MLAILQALPKGLAACADFSATPLAQNGVYFPWTDMDYQLAPDAENRIVRNPHMVTMEDNPLQPPCDPDTVAKGNMAGSANIGF